MARRNGNHRNRVQESGLADSAAHAVESVKDLGSEARSIAEQQLAQARDAAVGYWEEGRDQAMRWEESLEEMIREQPVKSLAIAVGAGFVLGFLFRGRS
jgi:ElaB/YqjD/DUF883 family membrane-anchored ribosome-binding protein